MKPSNFLFTTLMAAMLALNASADIFTRLRGPAAANTRLGAADGQTVYSADAEINGSPVMLAVRVFPNASHRNLAETLKRTGVANHLIIPSPVGSSTIVISIDKAGDESRPSMPSTDGLPNLPDFTPEFSAANNDTNTRFASGHSPLHPEAAMRSAASALARQGWLPATPDGASAAFFTKGGAITLVSASPREASGSSVLLMTKRR